MLFGNDLPVKVEILESQRRRDVREHDHLECEGGVVGDVGDRHGLGVLGGCQRLRVLGLPNLTTEKVRFFF